MEIEIGFVGDNQHLRKQRPNSSYLSINESFTLEEFQSLVAPITTALSSYQYYTNHTRHSIGTLLLSPLQ
jgi:hypothetical protein